MKDYELKMERKICERKLIKRDIERNVEKLKSGSKSLSSMELLSRFLEGKCLAEKIEISDKRKSYDRCDRKKKIERK